MVDRLPFLPYINNVFAPLLVFYGHSSSLFFREEENTNKVILQILSHNYQWLDHYMQYGHAVVHNLFYF